MGDSAGNAHTETELAKQGRVARFTLTVLLFFPFLYYPVVASVGLVDDRIAGLYKDAVAGGVGLLVFGALAAAFLTRLRTGAIPRERRTVLTAPEFWLVVFWLWLAVVSIFQREPTTIQNLIVYAVFAGALLLCSGDEALLRSALWTFTWLFVGALLVMGLVEPFTGFMRSPFGWQIGGPRLYASYGVLAVVALFAVPVKTSLRTVLGLALFAGAFASLSRASMTSLLVTLTMGLIVTAPRVWKRVSWLVPIAVALFVAALQHPWISSRMTISSITTPGSPINDSGRGFVWIPTLESWLDQPFIGLGAGSSQTVARESTFPLDHPHSEYLRILHDSGVVGFLLFGVFVVLALIWLWPRAGRQPRGELVVAGFLTLVAGLVLGTIENYLVFPSLMWPAAVFLGLGLAAARRDGQSFFDRRKVSTASSANTELPHR